ncbi:hypothetical protein [Roseovarius dicentrarchi]|uniref:hypothetical protein n=1 Tax=Roseovarius dicentrarchi TaxID=2250573 RepID=UPI0013966D5B|nr:hypothetical protein [Roseovarius dicentrarchi]
MIIYMPMQASEVEPTRKLMGLMAQFPTVFWNYANSIAELMLSDDESAGEQLAQLVAAMKADAEKAEGIRRTLAPILARAEISDPDARKGGLQ